MSSKINCFKYNVKPAHWVGHSKLRSLDTDNLFKRTPKFYENQSIVTRNTGEEGNAVENSTDDADENVEENEIIHKNKDKVVTIEEEKKNLEYQ